MVLAISAIRYRDRESTVSKAGAVGTRRRTRGEVGMPAPRRRHETTRWCRHVDRRRALPDDLGSLRKTTTRGYRGWRPVWSAGSPNGDAMSDLIAVAYPDRETAETVRRTLASSRWST